MAPAPKCGGCGTCPRCERAAYMRAWYRRNADAQRESQRASRQRRSEAVREYDRKRGHRGSEAHKEKARRKVRNEIRYGRLKPQPCEVGNDCRGRIEAHHDDYSKPLDVRWLCRRHHAEHHRTVA